MFSELTNFGYTRSGKQAVGFYLAYLLLGFLIGGLIGGLSAAIMGVDDMETSMRLGAISAVILVLVLGFLIAKAKGLLGSMAAILLILLAGIFAVILGALGGLLPIAYLTTAKPKATVGDVDEV